MIPSVSLLATRSSGSSSTGQLKDVNKNTSDYGVPVSTAFTLNAAGTTSEGWDWLLTGPASDFEVMMSPTSGDFSSPGSQPVNSWLDLSVNRQWLVRQLDTGVKSCAATLQLRLKASGDVIAIASITLTARVRYDGGTGGTS